MRLEHLQGAYDLLRFERILEWLQNPEITSLPDLSFLHLGKLDTATAGTLKPALYTAGKRLIFSDRQPDALRAFELARDLGCPAPLLPDRLHLLRQLPVRVGVEWRMNLQEMQRQFGKICTREQCVCEVHYIMAQCLGIFSKDEPEDLVSAGTSVAVLGLYHSWTNSTIWSKLIRRIKRDHEGHLVPFVARVAAGFMLNARQRWQDADVLVPVPPSPEKFGKRGFAPTDMIAAEISNLLAIPVRMALVRKPGVATRDANYDQLSSQFSLDPHKVRDLNKSRIVLIEDVVTTGRTVSICAEKLADAGPEAVDVLALARATRL